jgi:hypothetical protein
MGHTLGVCISGHHSRCIFTVDWSNQGLIATGGLGTNAVVACYTIGAINGLHAGGLHQRAPQLLHLHGYFVKPGPDCNRWVGCSRSGCMLHKRRKKRVAVGVLSVQWSGLQFEALLNCYMLGKVGVQGTTARRGRGKGKQLKRKGEGSLGLKAPAADKCQLMPHVPSWQS